MSNKRTLKSLSQVVETYEKEVDDLPRVHRELGGGAARSASGLVYENLIKRTCQVLSLDAKKNDFKRSEEVNGSCLTNLQVDWHVYKLCQMRKAVESKAYLDTCKLKRVVLDFVELENSPEVPKDVEYAILAGQNTCSDDALLYYPSLFTKLTGKEMSIFFLNPLRRRNAGRAIYNREFREDFTLDTQTYNAFVEFLSK
jgi:hypothetical protein